MPRHILPQILFSPGRIFTWMRVRHLLPWAIALQVFRWESTALTTMVSLYENEAPMLFPAPFGLDPKAYRMVEIILYGPYGLFIISAMAYFVWRFGKAHATAYPMTMAKTWELIGLAYFAPWLPSLLIDSFLIRWGWGGPEIIVPWHVSIVGVEALLTLVGLHYVFGITTEMSARLAAVSGFFFLFFAGGLMR
ncbi:MAG: hypothetical protein HQL51_14475 [Magnetococcales bacterium]|nr:hypothetical protein [Magnetococcales bacterium]